MFTKNRFWLLGGICLLLTAGIAYFYCNKPKINSNYVQIITSKEQNKQEVLKLYQYCIPLLVKNTDKVQDVKSLNGGSKQDFDKILAVLDSLNAQDLDDAVAKSDDTLLEKGIRKLKQLHDQRSGSGWQGDKFDSENSANIQKVINNTNFKDFFVFKRDDDVIYCGRVLYRNLQVEETKDLYLKLLKLVVRVMNKTLFGENVTENDLEVSYKDIKDVSEVRGYLQKIDDQIRQKKRRGGSNGWENGVFWKKIDKKWWEARRWEENKII